MNMDDNEGYTPRNPQVYPWFLDLAKSLVSSMTGFPLHLSDPTAPGMVDTLFEWAVYHHFRFWCLGVRWTINSFWFYDVLCVFFMYNPLLPLSYETYLVEQHVKFYTYIYIYIYIHIRINVYTWWLHGIIPINTHVTADCSIR